MAHFESEAEVYDQLGGILNNLVYNSARREQLRQADAVVQFAFRAPDATVTFDCAPAGGRGSTWATRSCAPTSSWRWTPTRAARC